MFAGLWLLFMGFSEYYGGPSTRNMYSGTILEHDADTNRIVTNAMSAGATKIGFGIVALLLGGGIAAAGRKSAPADGTPSGTRRAPTPSRVAPATGLRETDPEVAAFQKMIDRHPRTRLVLAILLICSAGAFLVRPAGNLLSIQAFAGAWSAPTIGFFLLLPTRMGNVVLRFGCAVVLGLLLNLALAPLFK